MLCRVLRCKQGLSLLELLVVIVVIAILVGVAMQSMTSAVSDMRRIATEREMEAIAHAITGDPSLASGGTRSDFGFVGDNGAFPPSLVALRTNPGGWSTWRGPYLASGFLQDSTGYLYDEWGDPYSYSGVTVSSTGSGTTISKTCADLPDDYLFNTYRGLIRDAADSVPGAGYRDSVSIIMTIPNGSGSTTTSSCWPDSAGRFTLDSIPAGMHPIRVVYLPLLDTLFRYVTILPRHRNDPIDTYRFTDSYFSAGGPSYIPGLTYVPGSAGTSGGNCDVLSFQVTNNSGSSITVSSIRLTWSGPTGYYEEVTFGGTQVYRRNSGLSGSGTTTTFSAAQTVAHGATVTVVVQRFRKTASGGGTRVDMSGVDLTVEFSDGSAISFNTGEC